MTTTNTPPTAQDISNILFKEGIPHYQDEISGSNSRSEVEIQLYGLLKKDKTKFFKALKIGNTCALQGYTVTISEHAELLTITI